MSYLFMLRSHSVKLLMAVTIIVTPFTISTSKISASELSNQIPCNKLRGSDLVKEAQKRFIIVGEPHGTNEAPKLFADLVCRIALDQKVLVLIEVEDNQQSSLDEYFISKHSKIDVEKLLKNDHWTFGFDGRASSAILNLVKYIARLKNAGLDISLKAFHPSIVTSRKITDRETAIAESWKRLAAEEPRSKVVILTGTYHIGRLPDRGGFPAAMHLPQSETLTIRPSLHGGKAWNCKDTVCGINGVEQSLTTYSRGIYRASTPDKLNPPSDLFYSTGGLLTASRPANSTALKTMQEMLPR